MIVVHIDTTSDGHTLEHAYKSHKDNDIILVNPTKAKVVEVLKAHPNETLMGLGHGSGSGLFGADWDMAIDSSMIDLLKDRDMIAIWCHAKDFGRKYGLRGFFTSMFVSNPNEASWYRFAPVNEEVTQERNIFFADKVDELIANGTPLDEWVDILKGVYDKSLDFEVFNYENLEYFDGTQKATASLIVEEESTLFNEDDWERDTNSIVEDLGNSCDDMRDCLDELTLKMGFGDYIEYDGDILTAEQISKWRETLEEIDKFTHFV